MQSFSLCFLIARFNEFQTTIFTLRSWMCVLAVWHNKGLLLFFNRTRKTIIKKTQRFWTFYFSYLCLHIILKQYSLQYTKPKTVSKSTSKVSVRSKWSRSQELFDQYFGGNKCYKSDNFAAVCSTASTTDRAK